MANWIYGSLTVKGPINNMLNFLNDGLQHMHNNGETPKPHHFFLNEDGEIDTHDEENNCSMYIKDSRRHFAEIDLLEYFNYDHESHTVEAYFPLEVAWGLEPEVFQKISEFGLLVIAFGDEWGMMFAQSFVFENGKMLKDSYRKLTGEDYEEEYPDEEWDWEEEQNEESTD